ncbi:hypothetical protein JW992_13880 [candidate division KSB1 bacterium]|nr:hypothetical protein [candidate division KSB1 bacterium]
MIKRLQMVFGFLLLITVSSEAQFSAEVELGRVSSGYNDVRIPGDAGGLFSLSEELSIDPEAFYRVRLAYTWGERHTLLALLAPLELQAGGTLDREIFFLDQTFAPETPLYATYRFNSYRLTYRYALKRSPRLNAALGFTAKIRDAEIALTDGRKRSSKTNIGFVPIVHFHVDWRFAGPVGVLLDGDALAAPQGRAEDVLLALTYRATDDLNVRAGYRILEGGADNDEVYNFSLFHYITAGVQIIF